MNLYLQGGVGEYGEAAVAKWLEVLASNHLVSPHSKFELQSSASWPKRVCIKCNSVAQLY